MFPPDQQYGADEVGILKLKMTEKKEVRCGDVGYIITGIKNAKEVRVGDTITVASNPNPEMIKGFVGSETHGICRYLPCEYG